MINNLYKTNYFEHNFIKLQLHVIFSSFSGSCKFLILGTNLGDDGGVKSIDENDNFNTGVQGTNASLVSHLDISFLVSILNFFPKHLS